MRVRLSPGALSKTPLQVLIENRTLHVWGEGPDPIWLDVSEGGAAVVPVGGPRSLS